jgi:uncharacterized protein (DUF2062 family)
MASLSAFLGRLIGRHAPTRDEMLRSRWLKPFGQRIRHSELWRFTRRSVPRGVAVGLFVGIFLMVPGVQVIGAALLSAPFRANIPVAAAMTFLSNPATTPFFLMAALGVGNRMGFQADFAAFQELRATHASIGRWLSWLFSDAAPSLVSGLLVISTGVALAGYLVSLVGWRWWTAHKWRRRQAIAPVEAERPLV